MHLLKPFLTSFFSKQPKFSLRQTIVLNFKVFSFKVALKMPIFVYGKWNFRSLKGSIIINSGSIFAGMYKFGADTTGFFTSSICTLNMASGSSIVLEPNVRVGQGVQICLFKNAILQIGEYSSINDNVKIICSKSVKIGKHSGITWESQVMDYNSHYTMSTNSDNIKSIRNAVTIGNYCWICNRTTIMPGTVLPDRIIVTSGSLLNKNYIKLGIKPYSMIGGTPAKLIKENVYRIYNNENINKINTFFNINTDVDEYQLTKSDNFVE